MKESTIQCSCIQPNFWCAICFGRTNHVQVPDPVSQEPGRIIALLDHSYHQVLSTKNDVPLEIQISHKLKSRDWVSKYISSSQMSKSARKSMDLSDSNLTAKERLEAKRQLKRKLKEERLEAKKRKKAGKKRLRLLKTEKRRKSITVSHHSDLAGATMTDLISDSGDQTPQPYQAMSTLAMAEQLRRKRETAFDIDNIVIPYSMAASVRVEKLKYKEILTPTWRLVDEDSQDVERSTDDLGTSVPSQSSSAAVSGSIEEDLSDLSYEIRHAKAEVEERKRWQLPVNKSGRSRSRRQDSRAEASSGYNTPDPMSPAPVVDSVEVSTRPSSPILNEDSNTSFSLSRIRRRTLSATKSRDRNPSEDTQSSRCTTPVIMEPLQEDVPPYDSRKFPLTDEEFNAMMADMPEGQEIEPGSESLPPPTAQDCPETETRASPVHQVSSRSSTADEGEETDPDWCEEDPGDPEWTGKNETPTVPVSSSTSGKRRVSISTKLP